MYGYSTVDGNKVIKVKGLSNEASSSIDLSDLAALLYKDASKTFTQERWFKSLFKGEINIRDQVYTLKVTANKRKLIYNDKGILVDTEPLDISD